MFARRRAWPRPATGSLSNPHSCDCCSRLACRVGSVTGRSRSVAEAGKCRRRLSASDSLVVGLPRRGRARRRCPSWRAPRRVRRPEAARDGPAKRGSCCHRGPPKLSAHHAWRERAGSEPSASVSPPLDRSSIRPEAASSFRWASSAALRLASSHTHHVRVVLGRRRARRSVPEARVTTAARSRPTASPLMLEQPASRTLRPETQARHHPRRQRAQAIFRLDHRSRSPPWSPATQPTSRSHARPFLLPG